MNGNIFILRAVHSELRSVNGLVNCVKEEGKESSLSEWFKDFVGEL